MTFSLGLLFPYSSLRRFLYVRLRELPALVQQRKLFLKNEKQEITDKKWRKAEEEEQFAC